MNIPAGEKKGSVGLSRTGVISDGARTIVRSYGSLTCVYAAMGTPLGPVKINLGDKIKDQFIVKKKIGEGACGQVYLVHVLDKNGKPRGRAAMKVEPLMKSKDDEILKMEIFVLKKIQNSRHVCRCLASGKTDSYTFVVMSLLGKELSDIRRRLPNRKISTPSTLRISIQVIRGLQDLHEAGFVHRDVKPSNLAMGLYNTQVVYIFDFGLARQILLPGDGGRLRLREPRNKVCKFVVWLFAIKHGWMLIEYGRISQAMDLPPTLIIRRTDHM
ncbi:hypothetical protein Y032_0286g1410 [Ancylostoma ceylanicum]|uniref:Protein kinase domain-containing protein n=1 Tax=Ancylostoma ceylanicum TaxID=53326 RepID=A0A016S6Y4_9BILA|nr:hypothetical protein Y032_0286g1410 [Ancylostoma ceylanicum]